MQGRHAGARTATSRSAGQELYDYLCTGCASSVGQREVTAGEKLMAPSVRPRAGRVAPAPAHRLMP